MFPHTEYYSPFPSNFTDFRKEDLWSEMLLGINKYSRTYFLDRLLLIEILNFALHNNSLKNSDSCALPYKSFKRQGAKLAEENASQI